MIKLTLFELEKQWKKRSFLLTIAALLLVNVFLLWYTELPNSEAPGLQAYKALGKDLEGLGETDKQSYISTLYEDIQGLRLVNDVLNYRANDSEMARALAEQTMADAPGVFEQYYDRFIQDDYLKYTDSLFQEYALIKEVWEEMEKVSGYEAYRASIQNKKDTLLGISVFASKEADAQKRFSRQNIEKEARAYSTLGMVDIRFFPSKGISSAVGTAATDLLVILSVFLFSCALIFEEKEKKLFYITRAAAAGRGRSILAKLTALAVHCLAVTGLFYGVNLIFFAVTTGVGDLFRSIQSVAVYMESPLGLSVFTYLLLTVLTKAVVLLALGSFIVLAAICAKAFFIPFLVGMGLVVAGMLLYALVPAYTSVNWLKYLNFTGLLKTENIYGTYLNFNLFGYPISRLFMSWAVLGVCVLAGCSLCALAFLKCTNMELSVLRLPAAIKFRPHGSLYRHEAYKLLVMNRAAFVIIFFTVLLGYGHLSKTYTPAPAEKYYQSLMLQLEGELTPGKEELIASEMKKYDDAFEQLDRIDQMVAMGEMDAQSGESMKTPYYSETAFYPAFSRVLLQYENVKSGKGLFIYDTGYFLLFGKLDNGNLEDYICLAACMLLAFSAVFSMEYRKKSWNLLSATVRGRPQMIRCKVVICMALTLAVCFMLWFCRIVQISRSFPLHQWTASMSGIAGYGEFGITLPVCVWTALMLMCQLAAVLAMAALVLLCSLLLKSHLQALCAGVLLLLVPPVLSMMGLKAAGWASMFSLYNMASGVLNGSGGGGAVLYFVAAVVILAGSLWVLRKAGRSGDSFKVF